MTAKQVADIRAYIRELTIQGQHQAALHLESLLNRTTP
jgi:hypothetical protein